MVGVTVGVWVFVGVQVIVGVGTGDPAEHAGTGVSMKFFTSVPQLVDVKFQSLIRSGQEPEVRDQAVAPTMPEVFMIQVKNPLSKELISPDDGGQVASGPYSPTNTG